MNKMPLIAGLSLALVLGSCGGEPGDPAASAGRVDWSEAPPLATGGDRTQLQVQDSILAVQAMLSHAEAAAVLDRALPPVHEEQGEKRICKKVFGLNLCGSARWTVAMARDAVQAASTHDGQIEFAVPMRFDGVVGIGGDVARAVGLSSIDVRGALELRLQPDLQLGNDWCPVVQVKAQHRWIEKPAASVAGLDIGLASRLDDVLKRQYATLDQRIASAIDCEQLRPRLLEAWQARSVPLELPPDLVGAADGESTETVYLNIIPSAFGFSRLMSSPTTVGAGLILEARTVVDANPVKNAPTALPVVRQVDWQPGLTIFELLIHAEYSTLTKLARAHLQGQQWGGSAMGTEATIRVDDVQLRPSADRLAVALAITAEVPIQDDPVRGTLYLTAQPVIDSLRNTLSFDEVVLTPILDNRLWNAIASLAQSTLINRIENDTVIELEPSLSRLETQLSRQLSQRPIAEGLVLRADELSINAYDVVPESDALAIRVVASSEVSLALDDTLNSQGR